jgi:starch-binding outer membrane protein, SusD/RagB family
MNIKKIYTGCIFSFFVLMFSCDDLLIEDPRDQIFATNFFENNNDAISAVNAIYAALNSTSSPPTFGGVYHSTYWVLQGLASDEMNNVQAGVPHNEQAENFNWDATNSLFYDLWSTIYHAISIANFALEGIPTAPIDEGLKTRLIGEASFLRGLLYFELVRMFGDIPLVLEGDDGLNPARRPTEEVYAQIIKDLNTAATTLPESYPAGNGLGRATRGAAWGILSKVHLTRGEWQLSIDNALKVMNSDRYGLWEDFAQAFRIANENGKETVFGIGFGDAGGAISFWEVGQFNVRLLPIELGLVIPGINAQGWQVATENLLNSFDQNDRRRAVTFITEVGGKRLENPHIRKYWDDIAEPRGGNTIADFPYMRYSEILLIYAEALNELNNGPNQEAYNAINAVRMRARFDGTQERDVLPDLSGLSFQQFKDALLLERRREFVAEGKRWFDLVRMDKLLELVPVAKPGVQPSEIHKLFPIPLSEIELNPNLLPQNPGY